MLFSEAYKRRGFKNSMETIGGFDELAAFLGLADSDDVSGMRSMKEITVYTCVKILAETLAKLPVKIYQDDGVKRKAAEHPLYPLLKLRPNRFMSASDFWRCVETQRNIYGNAYVWIEVKRDGTISGLYPLDPSRMQIYVDDAGVISSAGSVWYVFTDSSGVQHKMKPDELLHFKGLSSNGIAGMSTIETLRATIENAKSSSSFLNSSYKNGMTAGGIVHYVGDLDEKAKENFRAKFEIMAAGLKNANRISMLPVGYTFQPIELKLTDAQFLENSRFTIQQLTAAFGIKPHQVNDQTKTSYASTSEANREFYADTLLAILTMYEQELTWKLFSTEEINGGYYVRFNADVILRGDAKTRFETYAQAVQNMLKTPNECRALEEDEPMPGGDTLYGNAALAPATLLEQGIAYQKKGGTV